MKKIFLMQRIVTIWNPLFERVLETCVIVTFKKELDKYLKWEVLQDFGKIGKLRLIGMPLLRG